MREETAVPSRLHILYSTQVLISSTVGCREALSSAELPPVFLCPIVRSEEFRLWRNQLLKKAKERLHQVGGKSRQVELARE